MYVFSMVINNFYPIYYTISKKKLKRFLFVQIKQKELKYKIKIVKYIHLFQKYDIIS